MFAFIIVNTFYIEKNHPLFAIISAPDMTVVFKLWAFIAITAQFKPPLLSPPQTMGARKATKAPVLTLYCYTNNPSSTKQTVSHIVNLKR